MLNSPWYISGFQTLSPCRSRQGVTIETFQSFSQFRVTITLYEVINEPRLKTEPFVMCFLFFLSLKFTLKKSLLPDFSPLFLQLKNHYKHVLNSSWYISGFQTLSPCRSQKGMVIVKLQSFSQFRVTIILYEMINEPRLKTEPFVMCFLFFLSLKSKLKKSLLSDCYIILESINDGFRTAILVLWFYCSIKCFIWNIKLFFVKWFHIMFSCCFHVFFCATGGR